MNGIVACSRNVGRDDPRYYISVVDGSTRRVIEVTSSLALNAGEYITTNDTGSEIHTAEIEASPEEVKKLGKDAETFAKSVLQKKVYRSGMGKVDAVTEEMWKGLMECEDLLMRKLASAAPIIVRFHNDADGSSGAYGLYKSLADLSERNEELKYKHNITWIMHPSVSYGAYEAGSDLMIANNFSSVEKPLLIVIDFGTALESNPGIKLVEGKFDVIWLDHHPIVEGFEGLKLEHYINPWNHGGDSNYAAGFLTCVFAKTFSQLDTKEIENASLIGDYSDFGSATSPGVDLSMLLDLLTSDIKVAFGSPSDNLTPYEIDKVLTDTAKRGELTNYANMRLGEVMSVAMTVLKQYKGEGAEIYSLDFEGVRNEQSKFPLPGRFSSKLLGKIIELNGKPAILVVHSGRYISMRVSKELGDKVNLVDLINEIKVGYGELIEAGGGHTTAAGIKLADKLEKTKILKEVISILKRQLSGEIKA